MMIMSHQIKNINKEIEVRKRSKQNYFIPYARTNSKCIKDWNIRHKPIKILEQM